MSEQPVRVERGEGWGEIVIARPERRNALTPPVADGVRAGLEQLAAAEDVAAVILRGEGGYFCSGIDLKALQADPPPPWKGTSARAYHAMHVALYRFPKPLIGAFERFGINAGAALALACDLLIAGEQAFLQIGEIQQGATIPMNAAWLRIRTTEQVAARLALYGDRVPGPALVALGLAAESVPDDRVLARCRELAARIASFPRGASTTIKSDLIAQRGIEDPERFFRLVEAGTLLTAKPVRG